MFRYGVEDSGSSPVRKLTLRIGGKATVDHEEEIQKVFSNVLLGCEHLVVSFTQIAEVDVSFFMLLCVIHRKADLLKKRLSITGTLPAGSRKHFDFENHSRRDGCLFAARRRCQLFSVPDQAAAGGPLSYLRLASRLPD